MCRLFALRANQPTRVEKSLLSGPHSLQKQSCCDRRGVCHDSGWGIGYYLHDRPCLTRSALSARTDPLYPKLAETIASPTVLAHVRLASTGTIAEKNSHPFTHGRWLFAHNGTLFGFAGNPERLRRLIPGHLLNKIQGDTDSEHAFYFILAQLEQVAGSLAVCPGADRVGQVLAATIRTLVELYPGEREELSQCNFLLTNGRVMAASRWRHSLFWLERHGQPPADADQPLEPGAAYHAVAIASEPTTKEAWTELKDSTMLLVETDGTVCLAPIS